MKVGDKLWVPQSRLLEEIEAPRYHIAEDGRKYPAIGGGSGVTGTWSEVLFASIADGTALNTFTAEASLLQGLNEQPVIPAFFFPTQGGVGKTLRLVARGVLGSTATPTFTFFVRIGTTSAVVTGASLGQTAAITTGSGVTNQFWELECDIICRAAGIGTGNTTIQCAGLVYSPGFASPFTYSVTPAASATVWTATMDQSVTQYIMVSAACGTSNLANTIQLKQCILLGLN